MTNFDLEEELRPNLFPAEKFIWTGRPIKGILFKTRDRFMIPFGLIWGGFAVFWEIIAFATEAPLFFKLWGIPFVLIGLYLIIGRFFVDAIQRANTIYGLTSQRVLVKSGVFRKETTAFNIKTFSEVSLHEKDDSTGTITLWPAGMKESMTQKLEWQGKVQPPKIELIDDVKLVYDKIMRIRKQH